MYGWTSPNDPNVFITIRLQCMQVSIIGNAANLRRRQLGLFLVRYSLSQDAGRHRAPTRVSYLQVSRLHSQLLLFRQKRRSSDSPRERLTFPRHLARSVTHTNVGGRVLRREVQSHDLAELL